MFFNTDFDLDCMDGVMTDSFYYPLNSEETGEFPSGEQGIYYEKPLSIEHETSNDPVIIAQIVQKFFSFHDLNKIQTLKILDAAAKTGEIGGELFNRGFRLIDAVEASNNEKLMKMHLEGIYQNIYHTSIGLAPIRNISTNFYDAAVVIFDRIDKGKTFFSIAELVRVVSCNGGIVFIIVNSLKDVEEAYMIDLQHQHVWTLVARIVVFDRRSKQKKIVFVFEVVVDEVNKILNSSSIV